MKDAARPVVVPACLALALALQLAGCAAPPSREARPAFTNPALTLQAAADSLATPPMGAAPGRIGMSGVAAALGDPAGKVRFDSGYEVWVYRETPADPAVDPGELVLLFTPDGVLDRSRVRPAPPPAVNAR